MRKIATYEGIIENGLVKLPENANIPDKTRVYVLVPEDETSQTPYVASPRLVDPEKAKDFQKRVIKDTSNAGL
jgi:hypothetical protein